MRIHAAGDLNIRAFIENPSTVKSDSGGHTEQYTIVGECWIGVEATGGGESDVANRQVESSGFMVKLRRNSLVTSKSRLRIKSDGRVLHLDEPPRDPDGRGGDWVAMCHEILPDA